MSDARRLAAGAVLLLSAAAAAHEDQNAHEHGDGTLTHGGHTHRAAQCWTGAGTRADPIREDGSGCWCGWIAKPSSIGREDGGNHRHTLWPLTVEQAGNCSACGDPDGCPDDPDTLRHEHGGYGDHAHRAAECWDENASPAAPDPCQCGWTGNPDDEGSQHKHSYWPSTEEERKSCALCGDPEGCPVEANIRASGDRVEEAGQVERFEVRLSPAKSVLVDACWFVRRCEDNPVVWRTDAAGRFDLELTCATGDGAYTAQLLDSDSGLYALGDRTSALITVACGDRCDDGAHDHDGLVECHDDGWTHDPGCELWQHDHDGLGCHARDNGHEPDDDPASCAAGAHDHDGLVECHDDGWTHDPGCELWQHDHDGLGCHARDNGHEPGDDPVSDPVSPEPSEDSARRSTWEYLL